MHDRSRHMSNPIGTAWRRDDVVVSMGDHIVHRWQIDAVEEDAFGVVCLHRCRCGALRFDNRSVA